ncbi:sensor histidine kinase [Cohnella sp.]|uniref:cache domain-containing sensor histidine kinase n=1 Tax=Cohnella sp. TaxID=1883426 RepID=UPI0035622DF9
MLYSLRSRLTLVFSILLIVPFTAAIFLLSHESGRLLQLSIERSTMQTIDQFSSHAQTLLRQVEDIGTQIMSNRTTQDWTASLINSETTQAERVLAKQRVREFFSSYAVNNSNGITISAFTDDAGGLWTQDNSYVSSDWYKQFKLSGTRWTNAHFDRDQADLIMTSRDVNSFLLPMVHLQSLKEVGFVKINYPTDVLKESIEKIQFGKTGKAFLLRRDGKSVLNQPLGENREVLSAAMERLEAEPANESEGVIPIVHDGTRYLLFYSKLSAQDWVIIGEVPQAELYEQITGIRRLLLGVSVILLMSVIAAAFWISSGITKPLSAMARAMKHVERGEFGQAAARILPQTSGGRSEVGYVTRVFERMNARLRYLIETEFETNMRRKNAEYKALLLQINPHFYNNTLEIISGLAAMKREDLVMDATESLGRMMRYSLNLNSDLVSVHEEMKYIRDYAFILKLRYGDKLDVRMEESADAMEERIPKFILQPLLENAVKYSLEKDGQAVVSIRMTVTEDRMRFAVQDNGTGMTDTLVGDLLKEVRASDSVHILDSGGYSIGLRNVLARCRLAYGENFKLDITSDPNAGTAIVLDFPRQAMTLNTAQRS